jgi:hypothetical protein
MRSYPLPRLALLFTTAVAVTGAATTAGSSPIVTPVAAIANGVIIAHGNELSPPFKVAVENDTLCFYDGAGRRFARSAPDETLPAPAIPRPSLLGPAPTSAGAPSAPAIAAAQITHLLSGGGLVAFGTSYLCVFPPSSAGDVLADVRWVIQHAAELAGVLPPSDPLLRDLLYPVPLEPAPGSEDDATLRIEDPAGRVALPPSGG